MAGTVSVASSVLGERERRDPIIAPSLLSADPLRMEESLRSLGEYASWIHVDVMDGHFVPNMTYGPLLVKGLRRAFSSSVLDVHLMVENPEIFVEYFLPTEPSYLVFHVEATHHGHRLLQKIQNSGCRGGISLNPGTPVEMVYPLLPLVDIVLVMSVNPGFGGQSFLPEVLEKVEALHRLRTVKDMDFLIQIDGGVSVERAGNLVRRGCDVLVAGNAVFTAPSPEKSARALYEAALEGLSHA